MHDILRERLIRKIETLPEDQVYQTLDYIEFLEGNQANTLAVVVPGCSYLGADIGFADEASGHEVVLAVDPARDVAA